MSANDLLAAVFMFPFRINCTGTSKTVMSMNDRKGTVVTRGWLSSHQLTQCHLCFFTRASAQQPSCHHCFFTRASAQATHASPLFLYEGVCPGLLGSNPRITNAATLASPVFRYEDVCLATLVSPFSRYKGVSK